MILVVDDDEAYELLLPRLFEKVGSPVSFRFVRDGVYAIDYLTGTGEFSDRNKHPLPKLILLDLKMPRVDGFQVLEWKRKQPEQIADIPVVIWSSSDLPGDIEKTAALGASDYIVKPMFGHGLIEAIDRIYKTLTEARAKLGPDSN